MVKQYSRGDDAVFYATFLDENGGDSPVITNPVVTIIHYESSGVVTDISQQSMTQIGTTNQYYYVFNIPNNAHIGTYLVIYNVNINGTDVEADEGFQVTTSKQEGGKIV